MLHGPRRITVEERRRPSPGPHEVLMSQLVGICGWTPTIASMDESTLRSRAAHHSGHEASGVIEAVGENVTERSVDSAPSNPRRTGVHNVWRVAQPVSRDEVRHAAN
jgi:D-arabinose 1-dehydrogenase-like Zn-dependent alcohol dehydrogenase